MIKDDAPGGDDEDDPEEDPEEDEDPEDGDPEDEAEEGDDPESDEEDDGESDSDEPEPEPEEPVEDPKKRKEKKPGFFSRLFGKKKKADGEEDPSFGEEPEKGKKKEKKPKKEKVKKGKKKKAPKILKKDKKVLPDDPELENSNPKIRLYNEIIRHAYNYDSGMFSREGLTDDEIEIVFNSAKGDYPQLFWLSGYIYNPSEFGLSFRCKDVNGDLDIAQIKRKRKEIVKGAKTFTHGITRRTPPYKAFITIYRRLILTLDYDGLGLSAGAGGDMSKDDVLRSLHSALVEHKVVCAGYAVALQYLLQSVGITCAYVASERASDGSGHAFNIVKIGKYCYYVDATWGDSSNTATGKRSSDEVSYPYCCVPYREFIKTGNNGVNYHMPWKKLYPDLEQFNASNHEYYRYHKWFMSRLDENEMARIIASQTLAYDPKEMGSFILSIRFSDDSLANYASKKILSSDGAKIIAKARSIVAKKSKSKAKLLDLKLKGTLTSCGILSIYFDQPKKK